MMNRFVHFLSTLCFLISAQSLGLSQCDIAIPDPGCNNVTYQDTCIVCGDGSPQVVPFYINFPDQQPGEDYGITLAYGNETDGFQTYTNANYDNGSTIQFVIDTTTLIYLTEVVCPNGASDFDGLGDTVVYIYEIQPVFDNPGLITACDSVGLPPISGVNVPPNAAYYTQPGGGGTQYLPGDFITSSQFLWIYGNSANCTGEVAFEVEIFSAGDPSWQVPPWICANQVSNEITLVPTGDPGGTWSGPGITDNGDGTALFEPDDTGPGVFGITYTLGFGPCSAALTQDITVSEVQTEILSVDCNDNGTASDPSDDYYTATIVVNGINTGSTWTAFDPWQTTGSFGDTAVFGALVPNATNSFGINDDGPTNCQGSISIEAGPPCSTSICDIQITPGDVICNSNNTWFDPTDDIITQGLIITNGGAGGTFTANDPNNTTGIFGSITVFGPYNSNGEDVTFTITADNDPSCSIQWTVPHTCNVDCEIQSVIIDSVRCNDAGTPADDSDDYITFTANVNAGVDLSEGYFITSSAGPILQTFGYYDSLITFQTQAGTAGVNPVITITVIDFDNPQCTLDVDINNPGSCFCDLTVIQGDVYCFDNNTPNDPSDDLIGQGLNISNGGIPGTITANDPNNTTGPLDGAIAFGPYNTSEDITFTITVDNQPACSLEWTIPYICDDLCNIDSVEIGFVDCVDNGTPFDPSDDYVLFSMDPQGTNLGSTYTVNANFSPIQPGNASYGVFQVFSLPPGSAGMTDILITIIDDDDPACIYSFTLPNPGPCSGSTACAITDAGLANVLCNDAGTPGNPGDDYIELSLNPSGSNTGTVYSVTSNDVTITPVTGAYGAPTTFQLSGVSNAPDPITITITDAGTPDCSLIVAVDNVAPCSPLCLIQPAFLVVNDCDDNGTPGDPTDDTFTFELNMTGNNTGAGWTADDPLNSSGPYDVQQTLGPYLVANGILQVTVTDSDDPGCTFTFSVVPPAPCSNLPVCQIDTAIVGDLVCVNNGTPNDPSDDFIQFSLNVTGTSTGAGYNMTSSGTVFTPSVGGYGQNILFTTQQGSAGAGDLSITLSDSDDPACTYTFVLEDPGTCEDTCVINASFVSAGCLDNGTPSDPSDDLFNVAVLITGTGSTWTADDPGSSSGMTGDTATIGPFPISTGAVTITFTDDDNPGCFTLLTVTEVPPPCSDVCDIQVNLTALDCDDNGTPATSADDVYFATVEVTGANTSPEWIVSNPVVVSGSYGIPAVVGPLTLAGTTIITFTDSDDPECTATLVLEGTGGCSEGCPPADTTLITEPTCDPSQAGINTEIFSTVNGCDSIVITQTVLSSSDTTFLTETSCFPGDTGIVTDLFQNLSGCDSVVVTTTIWSGSDTTLISVQTCDSSVAGLNTEVFINANGCDSVVVTETVLLTPDTTFLVIPACSPADTGLMTDILQNTSGCDSIVITQTVLSVSDMTFVSDFRCTPADTGIMIDTFQNISGCDSIVITELLLAASDTTYILAETCNPADTMTSSVILSNIHGCDSVIVEQISLLPPDTTRITSTTCDPADSMTTVLLLTNTTGCDSIVIEEVIYQESDTTIVPEFTCDASDTATTSVLLMNAQGCDSLVIFERHFAGSDTTYVTYPTCAPDTISSIEVLTNAFGCDSVIIMSGQFVRPDTTFLSDASCHVQDTGVNTTILLNSAGCDSVVITTTDLLPSDTTIIFQEACNPADTGTTVLLLQNQSGCDSFVLTETQLIIPDTVFMNETICPGDSILIDSVYFSVNNPGGVLQIPTAQECDSVLSVSLDFYPEPVLEVLDTLLCPGDFIMINGEVYDENNPGGTQLIQNPVTGCDSIILVVNITFDAIVPVLSVRAPECQGGTGAVTIEAIMGAEFPVAVELGMDTMVIIESLPLTFDKLPAGNQILSFTDALGCYTSDTLIIPEGQPAEIRIDSIIQIARGEDLRLRPEINFSYDSIIWEPAGALSCGDCPEPLVIATSDTEVRITVFSEQGCFRQKSILLDFEESPGIFAPNVFSPDGDGVNDFFTIYTDDPLAIVRMLVIFDRWGNRVFEKNGFPANLPFEGWDGRLNDTPLNPGVYVFYAELVDGAGRTEGISGDLTLIR